MYADNSRYGIPFHFFLVINITEKRVCFARIWLLMQFASVSHGKVFGFAHKEKAVYQFSRAFQPLFISFSTIVKSDHQQRELIRSKILINDYSSNSFGLARNKFFLLKKLKNLKKLNLKKLRNDLDVNHNGWLKKKNNSWIVISIISTDESFNIIIVIIQIINRIIENDYFKLVYYPLFVNYFKKYKNWTISLETTFLQRYNFVFFLNIYII